MAELISDQCYEKDSALWTIARILRDSGDIERALEVDELISGQDLKTGILGSIARIFNRVWGHWQGKN